MLASDKFKGDDVRSLSPGTVLHGFTIQQGGREGNFDLLKWPWNPNKNFKAWANIMSELQRIRRYIPVKIDYL